MRGWPSTSPVPPSSASRGTVPHFPQDLGAAGVRHHRKAPSTGPGTRGGLGPEKLRGCDSRPQSGSEQAPHCTCSHHPRGKRGSATPSPTSLPRDFPAGPWSAARFALRCGLLRNLGGPGPPSESTPFLVGTRPGGCLCVHVRSCGDGNGGSQSSGHPHGA